MKFIRILIFPLLFFLGIINVCAYDFEVDGIYYNITSQSNLEVEVTYKQLEFTGQYYKDNITYSGEITIPESVNFNNRTYEVTGIGESAFGGSEWYSGANRYSYGKGCNVTSISLSEKIKYISKDAFLSCYGLKNITIPSSIREIGDFAFADTSISFINLKGVETIGKYAFDQCKQLSLVIFGESLTDIGERAFYDCESLLEVFYLGEKAPNLGYYCFGNGNNYLEEYVPSSKVYGFGIDYVTFDSASFVYSGAPQNVKWTNNIKYLNCEIPEFNTEINAGTYSKTVTAVYTGDVNLSVEIPFEYEILPAPMTLTVNDCERPYGNPNPEFTCNITGFVDGESLSSLEIQPVYTCEASQFSNVGNYNISAQLNAMNYDITYNMGILAVVPRELTVKANDVTRLFGEPNPEFTVSYTGFAENENSTVLSSQPVAQCSATIDSEPGRYPIIVSGGSARNYNLIYEEGTLTILSSDVETRVDTIQNYKIQVSVLDGKIVINYKGKDSICSVFNLNGNLVLTTSESIINDLSNGIYIIIVEGQTYKVII